jgi:hypothetical protein
MLHSIIAFASPGLLKLTMRAIESSVEGVETELENQLPDFQVAHFTSGSSSSKARKAGCGGSGSYNRSGTWKGRS